MQELNLLEKLAQVSPGMEIWWDASPLLYDNWKKRLLADAEEADREVLARQLERFFDPEHSEKSLVRGVTTNPAISLQAIKEDVEYWREVAFGMIEKNPRLDREALFWQLYKEIIKRGSDMLMPLFEKSGYREGYLSGQVDPRKSFDKEAMLAQAREIAAINPNVMVKIPGTKEGYEVLETVTSWGISTNNTLAFVVSQLLDGAKSVQRGLEKARRNNVDLTKWRSVITMMEARWGDLGGLRDFARAEGIELSEAEVRLAEMAILKKAYRLFHEGGYPSKLLSCSLRLGPVVDGHPRIWHLEEKAGGAIVLTCPPSFIADVITFASQENIVFDADRIRKEIPADVMERLLKVPYFARGYAEDGYSRDEYNDHPSLVRTADQFNRATDEMVVFAGKWIEEFKNRG